MDILLIPGLWLDGSAWSAVALFLQRDGHAPVSLTLPGQGDGRTGVTLQQQLDAVVAAVDASAGPCLVVGHSASATLAWLAADRRPEKVGKVALLGGFPTAEGQPYADFFPVEDGVMAFPGWAPFEGADSADLSGEQRDAIAAGAHRVPSTVTQAIVHYLGPSRYSTPVVVICPEFTPDDAKAWIDDGQVPELAGARRVTYVNIDSGHWPMFSRAEELARLLSQEALS